jgi:Protein of unknown function (DUF4242)
LPVSDQILATPRWIEGGTDGEVHGRPLGFFGITREQLQTAHNRDLTIQDDEGVVDERAWLDPENGKVFCLATGPSREAVMRIHERAGHPTAEVYELPVEV